MYHRKKLGVFISHIYGEYQHKLCAGILRKAKEFGYQVEIFTSNDGENVGDYGLGERGILQIPTPGNYDGFFLASSTYRMTEMADEITRLLQSEFHCPVIDIGNIESPFPSVMLENNRPMKDLVLHLGKVHGYSRIIYLGNRSEEFFSELRQHYFLAGLAELDLSSENTIFSCDGSEEDMSAVLERLIKQEQLPQAIACYNDALALKVIDFLRSQGLSVPRDIAVTGLDTLEFGQNTSPKLTSVTFPIEQLGETAVELFSAASRGENIPSVTWVSARTSIGSSCGCTENHELDLYLYTRTLDRVIARRESELFLDMRMSANLQGVEDLDKGMELIAGFVEHLPHCRQFYLCLYDGWDRMSERLQELMPTEEPYDTDAVLLKLAIRDGKRLPECTFTRRSTLPDYLYDGSSAFIYAPLFFREQHFGYLALSFDDDAVGYSFAFNSWLLNVNNMLKGLCDKKNLGLLAGRLEDIYTRDELTGLLNHQGFNRASAAVFEQAAAEGKSVCTMMFDLDCLKQINDTFGHSEGDFALRVLARALENSAEDNYICARHGNDEFQVLAPDCDEQAAAHLLEKVRKYLDNYNRLHTKNYIIRSSAGFCVRVPRHAAELPAMFREADQAMRRMKLNQIKNILKN